MNILVTGGAGFIGSHLTDSLIERGHTVTVVDNLFTGKKENINRKAVFHEVDVRDESSLKSIFRLDKIEFVYHLAAAAKIPWCSENPRESHEINVNGTIKLLELAHEFRVKGFVFSSSSSVYGELMRGAAAKEKNQVLPISVYGLQKYAAEQYCHYYNKAFGLPTASLRYFNVYGTSRQSPDGPYANVFTAFYRDRADKNKITIYGDGHQMRDFVHVYDVVKANTLFLDLPSKEFNGEIYNVGTGHSVPIDVIAMYFSCPVEYKEKREGDPMWSSANIDKLSILFMWHPKIDLKKGIEIFFKSYNPFYEIGSILPS